MADRGKRSMDDIEEHSRRLGRGLDIEDGRRTLEDRAYSLRYAEDGTERLTVDDVAQHLGCSPEEAHSLIDASNQRRQNRDLGSPP